MKGNIRLKPDQAARLAGALRSPESDDEHLSDEDFAQLAFDDRRRGDAARIEAHLAACESCRDELAQARDIARELNTEERRGQIDRLWVGFVDAAGTQQRLRDLVAAIRNIFTPVPRLATRALVTRTNRPIAEGQALDGRLTWVLTEEGAGDLKCVIVSSEVTALRGASLVLNTDPPRSVMLVEAAGAWRAEFPIAREEWRRMARLPIVGRIVDSEGTEISPAAE